MRLSIMGLTDAYTIIGVLEYRTRTVEDRERAGKQYVAVRGVNLNNGKEFESICLDSQLVIVSDRSA